MFYTYLRTKRLERHGKSFSKSDTRQAVFRRMTSEGPGIGRSFSSIPRLSNLRTSESHREERFPKHHRREGVALTSFCMLSPALRFRFLTYKDVIGYG